MILLGLGEGRGEGVKPNPNIVRIVNTIYIYGPSLKEMSNRSLTMIDYRRPRFSKALKPLVYPEPRAL